MNRFIKRISLVCISWGMTSVSVRMAGVLGVAAIFCTAALAKKPVPCDCMDVKLTPSKNLIKMTRTPEVGQALKALQAKEPARAAQRQKILATADTFLQRYINGDINQTQAPDDWDNHNGPIMGISMGAWVKLKDEQSDESLSNWSLCPEAKTVSLITAPNKTIVRYELLTVARTTSTRIEGTHRRNVKFSAAENGQSFHIDITLNEQNKVVDKQQMPQGFDVGTVAFRVSSLKHQINRMPIRKDDADITRAYKINLRQQLDGLTKAAGICKPQSSRR